MYSGILPLTSKLDGVGGQCHAPAVLPPGKTRYTLWRRVRGPQYRSGRVREISSPPGFDPQDCGKGTFLKTVTIHVFAMSVPLILF